MAGRCAGMPHFAMLEFGLGGVGSGCDSGWLVEATVAFAAAFGAECGRVVAGGSDVGIEC